MIKDMTEGRPLKLIFAFTMPMLIGGVFQQFYNVADTLIVGNFVGSRALAAVGATGSTLFFILSLTMGLTNAFSIVMSQYFGAKNEEMVRKTMISSIYITLLCIIILCFVGIFGARSLMELLKTPHDIIDDATLYIQICVGGSVGLLIYNGAAAVLRAVGDSRTPLYFLILSSILNVLLDLLFVIVFDMAVMGVAIATVIAQVISAVLCVLYIYKKFHIFRVSRSDWSLHWGNIGMISKIGVPMGLQSLLISIGEMAVTGVVNAYGTNAVAAYTTSLRVQQFATLAYLNIAQAFATFAAQNLGAKKPDRIQDAFKKVALITVGLSILSSILIFLFGDVIIRWFISDQDSHLETIVEMSGEFLLISACFFPFLGLIWLYNNTLRGMGVVTIPLISSVVELISKVGLSLLLGMMFGYIGVWYAGPIGWALGLIPSFIEYHSGRWKRLADRIVG
ncbi:MATE family efflux transporter [Lederbergia lenta]|uniref:Probable multidrug resistance protein NorM n=1 Tax=Lederbergia lenta TaxID=1467 RepID=A0A2X4VN99_LEDLE|nr:MATE family efflux transporter [Lederbergia lenta]MCM3110735.1 MATE family efflux transporter [Lederbergia lenta]MEC2325869.1 MATE family efflux transporter [Lederbergia lenta]SQI53626.1 damage inducible, Na+ driven multidrug efflux pump [Lederbergia lenta]